MEPTRVMLWGVLVPALLAFAALLASRRRSLGAFALGPGAAAAYAAAHLALVGLGSPAADITHALLWIALGAAVWAVLERALAAPLTPAALHAARALASFGAAFLLLKPLLGTRSALVVPALAALLFVTWSALAALLSRARGPGAALLIGLWTASAAATVLMAGNASTAVLALPVLTLLGAGFVLTLRQEQPGSLSPLAPLIAGLSGAQLAVGFFYTDGMSLFAPLLLVGALGSLLLVGRLLHKAPQRRRFIVQLAALSLLLGLALAPAAGRYFGGEAEQPMSPGGATDAAKGTPARPTAPGAPASYERNYGY